MPDSANRTKPAWPLGVTSMMFWTGTVEQALPKAAQMGYDAVEIWAEHLWRAPEDPARVGRALRHNGLRCTVHCPIMDLNITSPNHGIRAESLRQMRTSVELTHDLASELLVLHPGALYSGHDSLDEYWRVQLEAFENLVRYARDLQVRVAVENMDFQSKKEPVKSPADIQRIRDHFAPGELGFVLDTTHLGTTERVLAFVEAMDDIHHVHLSDAEVVSADKVRTHLRLGEGNLDLQRVVAAILPRLRGILSLETFVAPGNDHLILAQKEYLDSLLRNLP